VLGTRNDNLFIQTENAVSHRFTKVIKNSNFLNSSERRKQKKILRFLRSLLLLWFLIHRKNDFWGNFYFPSAISRTSRNLTGAAKLHHKVHKAKLYGRSLWVFCELCGVKNFCFYARTSDCRLRAVISSTQLSASPPTRESCGRAWRVK